jgi:hypothetical protein
MSGLVNPELLAGNPVDDVFMDLNKLKFKGKKNINGAQGLSDGSLEVALEMDVRVPLVRFHLLNHLAVFSNRETFQSFRLSFIAEDKELGFPFFAPEIRNVTKSSNFSLSSIQPLDSSGNSPLRIRESFEMSDIDFNHRYWKDLFGATPSSAVFSRETSWAWQGPTLSEMRPAFELETLDDDGISDVDVANNRFWGRWIEEVNLVLDGLRITHVAGHRPQIDHASFRNQNREFLLDPKTSSFFGEVDHLASVNRALYKLTNGRYQYFLVDSRQLHSAEFELDGQGNIVVKLPLEREVEEPRDMSYAIIDKSTDAFLQFDDVGSGLSDVLPVLAALTSQTPGLIYIEQPELHLHPKMQMQLAEIVVESLQGKQIFIETHSENLLIGIQRQIRLGNISADEVAILYAEPSPESPELGNHIFNLSLDGWGDLLDPFPESFVDLRAHYLFDAPKDD